MSSHTASTAFCTAPSPFGALSSVPVRNATDTAALDRLDHLWQHVMSFGDVSDAATFSSFSTAYRLLEAQALRFGMPEDCDDAADWAEQFLTRVAASPAFTPGTAEYRARLISRIWHKQLWHEVVMVAAGVISIGLLFFAIARSFASWAL